DLVALSVPVEALHAFCRPAKGYFHVVVPHQQLPAAELVPLGLDRGRLKVPVRMRVGDPLLALDRPELAELADPARRLEVVEDRLVPGEPLEAEDLLRQEQPVLAELDVPLARDVAAQLVRRHGPRIVTAPRRGRAPPGALRSPAR